MTSLCVCVTIQMHSISEWAAGISSFFIGQGGPCCVRNCIDVGIISVQFGRPGNPT